MKQVKVNLGGREYVLTEKVMGVTIKWRQAFNESGVMQVMRSLDNTIEIIVNVVEGGVDNIQMEQTIGLARLVPLVVNSLGESIDDVRRLLYDYAPEIAADHAYHLEHTYDTEVIAAFIEVLKLNFPITALWGLVRGSRAQPIATNLPSANGAGLGKSKPMARSKSR